MPKFKPYNHQQSSIVVIHYEEPLQTGTFEHAIHYLIHHTLDLSIFNEHVKNASTGRKAYDPAILLSIILFAYSKGITSSREIQWCCETNIIFKAWSCATVPHFTTIAHFVSAYPDALEQLFEQVLLICHPHGLAMNCLRLMAANNLPMRPKSGLAPAKNSHKSGLKLSGKSSIISKNTKQSTQQKPKMKRVSNARRKPSTP